MPKAISSYYYLFGGHRENKKLEEIGNQNSQETQASVYKLNEYFFPQWKHTIQQASAS